MADEADIHTLGDVVRDARRRANLTLRELADKLSVTPSYISDIENDRRVPAEDVLRGLSDELELEFDRLMALAGRLGGQTERYLRRHPTAGVIMRRFAEANAPEVTLQKILRDVEKRLQGK